MTLRRPPDRQNYRFSKIPKDSSNMVHKLLVSGFLASGTQYSSNGGCLNPYTPPQDMISITTFIYVFGHNNPIESPLIVCMVTKNPPASAIRARYTGNETQNPTSMGSSLRNWPIFLDFAHYEVVGTPATKGKM